MTWYMVYKGKGRGRDGKLYSRVFVKKLRLGRIVGKPKIAGIMRDSTAHTLVDIIYKKMHTYRGGARHARMYKTTIVLGQYVNRGSIRLTQHPPKKPKIDRK